MKSFHSVLFIYLTLGLTLGQGLDAYCAEKTSAIEDDRPKLESVQDGKTVTLKKEGKEREASAGTPIEYGEKVITREEGSAVVLYPDGSKISITANSEFTIEERTEGTQWNRLKSGSVRGLITKTTLPSSTKPKFIIRNRAAVLGVRGTDFVMAIGAGNTAQVHTLEGTVEVAKSEVQLLSSKGTLVTDGHFVEASQSGLSAPQTFNKAEYLKSLDSGLTSGTTNAPAAAEGPATGGPAIEGPLNPGPPPTMPAPTKFPPPQPPASKNREPETKNEKPSSQNQDNPSESKSGFSLLAFQAGFFYSVLPDTTIVRAVNMMWTPRWVLPYLTFLSIHPAIGGSFAPNGSLNNNFLVMEYQLFLTLSLFETFYGEAGMGEQIWKGSQTFNAGLATVNAGILLKAGFIDRVFVGYQVINYLPVFNEYKIGIGIKF